MSAELLDELVNDIEKAMDNVHDMGVSLRAYAEAAAQAVCARIQNLQETLDAAGDAITAQAERIGELEREAYR